MFDKTPAIESAHWSALCFCMADSLSPSRLRHLLSYDPKTGIFRWRVDPPRGTKRKGTLAGSVRPKPDGRRAIMIDKRMFFAGRLAFLYMTGKWPRQLVDHANGVPDDDRWCNLREADHSQNAANSRGQKQRLSPFKGAYWDRGKYTAQIIVRGQRIYLGRFILAKEAHAAYIHAARRFFGEYARAC
jgi:hypothetical protein